MAKVNLVNKKVSMELDQIIRFQIITHCFINLITVSELDLDCLVMLGVIGDAELKEFCEGMAVRRNSSSSQSIRNTLVKLEKKNLIIKTGNNKKKMTLNPSLKIQTKGNILLDYKIVRIETPESQRVYQTGILEAASV